MPEKQKLITISVITDDDTGMYHIGELDGILQNEDLEDYLRRYGAHGKAKLLEHFAFLQYQVIKEYIELSYIENIASEENIKMPN